MNEPTILSHLDNVQGSGSGWTARCPAHRDSRNVMMTNGKNELPAAVAE